MTSTLICLQLRTYTQFKSRVIAVLTCDNRPIQTSSYESKPINFQFFMFFHAHVIVGTSVCYYLQANQFRCREIAGVQLTCALVQYTFIVYYYIAIFNELQILFGKIQIITYYFCRCFINGPKHLHSNSGLHTKSSYK